MSERLLYEEEHVATKLPFSKTDNSFLITGLSETAPDNFLRATALLYLAIHSFPVPPSILHILPRSLRKSTRLCPRKLTMEFAATEVTANIVPGREDRMGRAGSASHN